jgi:superfamily I DNA/RNA helicase
MTQEVYDVLFHIAEIVGAGACGGLIVLLFDHILTISRDGNTKRKRFRSYIELLRRDIESKESSAFVFDYHRTVRGVPKFEAETMEIRSQIRERNVIRFDAACADYKTISFGEFGENEKHKQAKAKLISLLDEVSECAK